MNHLYIIGNGFDLHHNVMSAYKNFAVWLKNTTMKYSTRIDEFVITKLCGRTLNVAWPMSAAVIFLIWPRRFCHPSKAVKKMI